MPDTPNQNPLPLNHAWFPPMWERKYSFALIGILASFLVLYIVHVFQFPEKQAIVAILSTHLIILLITIVFMTGQAKIDIQALYGRPGNVGSVFEQVANRVISPVVGQPPNGGKVGL